LIIKVENSEPTPWPLPLDLQKNTETFGSSDSEDKKPVNKKSKSRMGTHPSKVQGK
jgi:hypothetical protein